MILYFDTETTGLCPGQIIQLSYVMDYGNELKAKNFFFAVGYIDAKAQEVHGFSVEKIFELSKGKIFDDFLDEIKQDFESASLLVAHNIKFDLTFMNKEFECVNRALNIEDIDKLDTCSYFTNKIQIPRKYGKGFKPPKLIELSQKNELYEYDITRKAIDLFGEFNNGSHDARYDTVEMYLNVKMFENEFEDLKEILSNHLENIA